MTQTVAQLTHKFLGKKALLVVRYYNESKRDVDGEEVKVPATLGMQIPVRIIDARSSYGRDHVLVRPLRGVGSAWVEINDKLVVVDEWPQENNEAPGQPE